MLSGSAVAQHAWLQELRSEVEAMDARGTRGEGPRLVARAWLDADFKARLLQVRCDHKLQVSALLKES
jgi:hypothetical protein